MNNKENAGGLLCTDEERLLISRATELSVRTENSAVALSFLTPREQRLVFEAMERVGNAHRVFFWGGCVGAERRAAVFLPDWLIDGHRVALPLFGEERELYFTDLLNAAGFTDVLCDFVSCVKLRGSGFASLSHRDILGAVMALGIKRSVVGDICFAEDGVLMFCESKAVEYITKELKRAGRDTVKVEPFDAGFDFRPEKKFEEIRTTVASPRLDGTVRALCNVSRDEALSLVLKGLAEVNYFVEKEPDRRLVKGDILTVRGYGKYIIDSAEDENRRGRIKVAARKYT